MREDADCVEAAADTVRSPSWGRSDVRSFAKVKLDVQVGQGVTDCSHVYVWLSNRVLDQGSPEMMECGYRRLRNLA